MNKMRVAIAALTISASAFVGLLTHEGYTSKAIIPVPGDVATYGFGTTDGVKMGDSIDPVTAVNRAHRDVTKFEGALKQCVRVPLYQHEYDAYVQLLYNVGPGKVGVSDGFCWLRRGGNSTLVRKLNDYDYEGACDEILKWNKFKGKELPGLTNRRKKEHKLCRGLT